MTQEKQYRILIVERDPDTRERIAGTFAHADLSSSVAEEKSVARAITHLLNANLNVLVIGPGLDIEEAKKLTSCPSNFGKRVVICFDEDIAEQLSCKNILLLPFLPEDGKIAVLKAFNPDTKTSDNETRTNEAMQLAFVIGRLVERMQRIVEALKKEPKDIILSTGSIPEAVNLVIAGASKIRKGYEAEDIKTLLDELFE